MYPESHPFGLKVNESGICKGCIVHEERKKIDWEEKRNKLRLELSKFRTKNKNGYDCLIEARGDLVGCYAVHKVVTELKLKPLLVFHNGFGNTLTGIKNIERIRQFYNLELVQESPPLRDYKSAMRNILAEKGHVRWLKKAGQTSFLYRIAIAKKIPLIFFPELQTAEQVGMFNHGQDISLTSWYRDTFDLEVETFEHVNQLIPERLLKYYMIPWHDKQNLECVQTEFLSQYFNWDLNLEGEKIFNTAGLEKVSALGLINEGESIQDIFSLGIDDILKFAKYGTSKLHDQVVREIRFGRMDKHIATNLLRNISWELRAPLIRAFVDFLELGSNAINFILREINKERYSSFEKLLETQTYTQSYPSFIFHRGLPD